MESENQYYEEQKVKKEPMIRKIDAAKEVLKLNTKIKALGIVGIVAPLGVLFFKGNMMFASLFAVGAAMVGGWFVRQSVQEIKRLQGKYNLR